MCPPVYIYVHLCARVCVLLRVVNKVCEGDVYNWFPVCVFEEVST